MLCIFYLLFFIIDCRFVLHIILDNYHNGTRSCVTLFINIFIYRCKGRKTFVYDVYKIQKWVRLFVLTSGHKKSVQHKQLMSLSALLPRVLRTKPSDPYLYSSRWLPVRLRPSYQSRQPFIHYFWRGRVPWPHPRVPCVAIFLWPTHS